MSSRQRDKSQKRELLFCVTQPVNDGWLTTTLILQYDFTADRSEQHEMRLMSKTRVSKEALHPDVQGEDAERSHLRQGAPRVVPVQLEELEDEEDYDEEEADESEDEESEDE